MTHTAFTPRGSFHGWSRMAAEDRWTEVVLQPGAGSSVSDAVLRAFPGAVLHAVVTDVLGPNEARIHAADGRQLVVELDNDFRVTSWRAADNGRLLTTGSLAA